MSAVNHCDTCATDTARVVGRDGEGGPLSWCPTCGTLMGFGTVTPASHARIADLESIIAAQRATIRELQQMLGMDGLP